MEYKLEEFKNLNVLYVEDESFIRTNVESCLKYFFNVIIAKDGKEGLEIFKNNNIDLIITDISMPHLDGLDMMSQIKSIKPNIPFIVTSAYDKDFIIKAEKLGATQYLSKPFDVKDLLNNSVKILKTA